MSRFPAQPEPEPSVSPRLALEDARTLSKLRRQVFESAGPTDGAGILYSLSFCEGMLDGVRVMQGYSTASVPGCGPAGALLPIAFRPEGGVAQNHFRGSLRRSLEAELHQREYPVSSGPICFVSQGYAAGWYSAILGETILVREVACAACGEASCRFEARPVEGWLAEDDPWAHELLPFLDLNTIRKRAEQRSQELEDTAKEGDMLGNFDPMSPAVHVWGPVMILPYSGPDDGVVALDSIREDVGCNQIRVVVVDATGARIDPLEAVGLTLLLDALEAKGVETIMVGLGDGATRYFQARDGGHAGPLLVSDISQAIALGFQLSQSSPGQSRSQLSAK